MSSYQFRLLKRVEVTDYICEKLSYLAYAEWRKFNQDLLQLFRNEEYLSVTYKLTIVFLLNIGSKHSR